MESKKRRSRAELAEEYAQDRRFLLELSAILEPILQASALRNAALAPDEATAERLPQMAEFPFFDLLRRGLEDVERQDRIWQTIPKAIARGRCRNETEYYLLKERLIDMGDETLSPGDRETLGRIVGEFEDREARAVLRQSSSGSRSTALTSAPAATRSFTTSRGPRNTRNRVPSRRERSSGPNSRHT